MASILIVEDESAALNSLATLLTEEGFDVLKASDVRPTSAGEALLALAPSTVMQMPYDGGAILAPLGRLLRSLPSFAIDVGDDRDGLAGALREVLERATEPSRLLVAS